MSETPKKLTLGEMLKAGERPFVDRERFKKNLLEISEHSERVLRAMPLPALPGRPRKGGEVEETEAITVRVPRGNLRFAEHQAGEMGVSRNRWINIAISRQLQDPITEAELKPSVVSKVITFKPLNMHVDAKMVEPALAYASAKSIMQSGAVVLMAPGYFDLAVAGGNR